MYGGDPNRPRSSPVATDRRLVSGLFCVGYSWFSGADEDRIPARLRALRSDLIDPTIAVHDGRVVKRTGVGALVEFRSVVDAVSCAIEVQNAMVERSVSVPADRGIEFRVGIHLGATSSRGGQRRPDGRRSRHRSAGAICLSGDAYQQVGARLDLAVNDLAQWSNTTGSASDPSCFLSAAITGGTSIIPAPQLPRPSVQRYKRHLRHTNLTNAIRRSILCRRNEE
jgi:class 3 adenylate cyclase